MIPSPFIHFFLSTGVKNDSWETLGASSKIHSGLIYEYRFSSNKRPSANKRQHPLVLSKKGVISSFNGFPIAALLLKAVNFPGTTRSFASFFKEKRDKRSHRLSTLTALLPITARALIPGNTVYPCTERTSKKRRRMTFRVNYDCNMENYNLTQPNLKCRISYLLE